MRVVDPERDGADAVAVAMDVVGDRVAAAQRGGEDEADLALLDDVRGAIALAGLRAGVGDERHAEGGAIKIRSLARIADVKLDVIGSLEGEKIRLRLRWFGDCGARGSAHAGSS